MNDRKTQNYFNFSLKAMCYGHVDFEKGYKNKDFEFITCFQDYKKNDKHCKHLILVQYLYFFKNNETFKVQIGFVFVLRKCLITFSVADMEEEREARSF